MAPCRTTPSLTTRFEDLAEALRSQAEGVFCAEAAVGLLVGHGSWLLRDDFVGDFVECFEGVADQEMAVVDWRGAVGALDRGALPCSSSEEQILRLVASFAEGVPVDLRDAVCGLDA